MTSTDRSQVLALLRASLGWGDDPRYEELFTWKHDANPFGPSPAWVAVDAERVVGFRTFMRWEFQRDGKITRAVRAVDTATHPDYQGQGIFRRLTLHALEELRSEGVAFVFNTPNRESRPGYLRMGWQEVGRLAIHVRPRGLGALVRIARARVAADRWPFEGAALPGVAAAEALAHAEVVEELVTRSTGCSGLCTRRTPRYLAWRYGLAALGYRALLRSADPSDGFLFFRVRQRRPALEVAILDSLVPRSETGRRSLIPQLIRECGVDYAIALRGGMPSLARVPLPLQGPILTWRGLAHASMPPLQSWQLTLGDVELF